MHPKAFLVCCLFLTSHSSIYSLSHTAPSVVEVLAVGTDRFSFIQRREVEEVWRAVHLVVEFLRIGERQIVLHVRVVPHSYKTPTIMLRAHLHPATAMSLRHRSQISSIVLVLYCYIKRLRLQPAVAGESLCEPFGSDVAATSQTHR